MLGQRVVLFGYDDNDKLEVWHFGIMAIKNRKKTLIWNTQMSPTSSSIRVIATGDDRFRNSTPQTLSETRDSCLD
jgi:hypothetical protein